ncbi:berberine bridge enzyme-like 26 [Ricinus communis]|uniref:Reticuline oxidase, putative n=1 Tax=Ricinus communis TaxID=3988 RepID=B9SB00_RICCO|nr:berberine bridge enzyme-like 26 [Ricinus communis]EEF39191.1 Reticuline oxidase precursor, putative [Ricinus communis]|eukprot:XP_002523160.1 berberine bridge enzyme-like 26 [Ricinus communis]
MEISKIVSISLLVILLALVCSATSNSVDVKFLQCFSSHLRNSKPISQVILPRNSSRYSSVLQSSIRNLRFSSTSALKPEFIITPFNESHIQAAVVCAKAYNMLIRTRSGGHDYEGLSYVSDEKFVLVDLASLRSISVDIESESAWVESGATLGELYYKIAEKSNVYGFPAGSCPTVGVGGHISGGGFGTIFRKYGLASDAVIDAKLVNVNGEILDRESMGEDLFWAIRGGGGASFGIILSWKVRLVSVPPTVTVFSAARTLEQGGSKLLHKWQTVGNQLPEDLFLHAVTGVVVSSPNSNRTIQISFDALYLGTAEQVIPLMQSKFPELGITRENCTEMSWIQSVLYFAGFPKNESLDVLLNRKTQPKEFSKAKADYVQEPISETGLEGLYKRLLESETSMLILTPYGGRMSEISESEIPFPHRNGNLYKIQYLVTWDVEEETKQHIEWIRSLYSYMAAYVSKLPRAAYLNYRDLDLGRNKKKGNTSFAQASVWGLKYFKNNFKRLVNVKTAIDPSNFFRNEQSIPLHSFKGVKRGKTNSL